MEEGAAVVPGFCGWQNFLDRSESGFPERGIFPDQMTGVRAILKATGGAIPGIWRGLRLVGLLVPKKVGQQEFRLRKLTPAKLE